MIFGFVALFVMGIILSVLGAGGAILVVPILVYLFKVEPLSATTDSLFIVGVLSLISSMSYIRKKEFNLSALIYFLLPSLLGVFLVRNFVLPTLPSTFFGSLPKSNFIMLLFGQLMLGASLSMFKSAQVKGISGFSIPKAIIVGFIVGGVTSLVGAGGGFLMIPALVLFLGVPMRKAVGTSLIMIALNALLGFFVSYQKGYQLDFDKIGLVLGASVTGVLVGLRMKNLVPEALLKKTFASFVLAMSLAIIYLNLP